MPRDIPDVWRDEDGPHPADLAHWETGNTPQLNLDRDGRRIVRLALKTAWASSPDRDRTIIDRILEALKR